MLLCFACFVFRVDSYYQEKKKRKEERQKKKKKVKDKKERISEQENCLLFLFQVGRESSCNVNMINGGVY